MCCPGRIIIVSVGTTYIIGGSRGYACGTHIDNGNRYVVPRKLTGSVPERWSSKALVPFEKASEVNIRMRQVDNQKARAWR